LRADHESQPSHDLKKCALDVKSIRKIKKFVRFFQKVGLLGLKGQEQDPLA
jgi:hypothetical protein